MDFVHEQHIAALQVGENGGEVAGAFQHRAGGLPQTHAHLVGHHVGQGGFAQAGRAEHQQVVEGFLALLGGLEVNLQLLAHGRLADVFVQVLRAQAGIRDEVFNLVFGGNDALFRRRHALLPYSWA